MISYPYKNRVIASLSLSILYFLFSFTPGGVKDLPNETIYLHTDKPYYSIGDTIWFKAYVTMGEKHLPSTISGACYVDLINAKNTIETTLKLAVKGGMAAGHITLDEIANEGIYRLRAYTQWMRNAGEERCFDKAFIIGDGFGTRIIEGSAKDGKLPSVTINLDAKIQSPSLMRLKISSDKPAYKPRELVELDISAFGDNSGPAAGDFSISVIDENKVPYEEDSTILSNILLALDSGGSSLPSSDSTHFFAIEKSGVDLSGTVKTLTGNPVPIGKVSLLSLNGGIMEETKTDTQGRFKFENILVYGDLRFMVQAKTQTGSKQVELVMDKMPAIPYPIRKRSLSKLIADTGIYEQKLLKNRKKQDKVTTKTNRLSRTQQLDEVKIKAKKTDDTRYASQGGLRIPEGHSDQTYIIEQPELCASLGICLQGKLHGVIFREREIDHVRYASYPSAMQYKDIEKQVAMLIDIDATNQKIRDYLPMDVILDGRKLDEHETGDIFSNNTLNPNDIAKIEVVRTNLALSGMIGGPAILIYTKNNNYKFKRSVPNIAYFEIKGLALPKQFYSPQYAIGDRRRTSDFRSAIYWNPNVQTDKTGKTTVRFFTADDEGIYKVILEGFNKNGELGRQVYRFKVSKKP